MPWKGGLIVTSAPDILFMKDENGDGKADVRKVLYTGFPKVNHEARITNPRLGTDNWIYCSNSGSNGRITSPDHPEMPAVLVRGTDFRFDPISGKAEAASGPAQFGSTLDDFGNRFISQNTTHIRHVVVPMNYLARAPLLEVHDVAQDISDHGRPSSPMYPLTGPQEWRKQRTGIRQQRYDENNLNRTEQVGGWFTAASGGTLYNGDAFPKEYVGNVFTGDVSGNLIHRDILRPDGATFCGASSKGECRVPGLDRYLVPALPLYECAGRQSVRHRHLSPGDRDAGVDSGGDSKEDQLLQRRHDGTDLSHRAESPAAEGRSEAEPWRVQLG